MISLPFLKKKKPEDGKFLTITIDSTEIKSLLLYREEQSFKILAKNVKLLEQGSVRAGNLVDIDKIAMCIKESLSEYNPINQQPVLNTVIGVTGDLCLGLTTTVRLKRTTPKPVSQKEIDELNQKINEAAYMQAVNEYLQVTGNSEIELETITTSSVYTKVDGNMADNLINQSAGSVEVSMFNAFTPSFHIKNIMNLAKKTGLNVLALGYELYTLTQLLKMAELDGDDFIILDISNDSTNVAVVFGGSIVATKNFSVGYKHFSEGLSEKLGITLMEAQRMLRAYISGSLTQSELSIIQIHLTEVIEIWIQGLEILFAEFSGVKTFPSKVYVVGVGVELNDTLQALSNGKWVKSIPFKEPPVYQTLGLESFSKIINHKEDYLGPEWLSTAALGIIYKELKKD